MHRSGKSISWPSLMCSRIMVLKSKQQRLQRLSSMDQMLMAFPQLNRSSMVADFWTSWTKLLFKCYRESYWWVSAGKGIFLLIYFLLFKDCIFFHLLPVARFWNLQHTWLLRAVCVFSYTESFICQEVFSHICCLETDISVRSQIQWTLLKEKTDGYKWPTSK